MERFGRVFDKHMREIDRTIDNRCNRALGEGCWENTDHGSSIRGNQKGEHGALLFKDKNIFFAPALPLEEVFDPTGAGDTFAGGFAGYLAATGNLSFENLKNAVIYGSNLASFCVERFGTERMKDLKKEEVEARLQQFKELTQFNIELE